MNVLLADDHKLFIEGMSAILSCLRSNIQLSSVYDGRSAFEKLQGGSFKNLDNVCETPHTDNDPINAEVLDLNGNLDLQSTFGGLLGIWPKNKYHL